MYDMWGDTVNVASRMESEGITGKIQLSEATYDLVKLIPDLKFTSRGEVEIKGKGNMKTWLLEPNTTAMD
jgi:class 3 adenylate cyclase